MNQISISTAVINEFLIGFFVGVMIVHSLAHVAWFRAITVAGTTVVIVYLFSSGGVDAVISEVNNVVTELLAHMSALRGLLVGNTVAGLWAAVAHRFKRGHNRQHKNQYSRKETR